MFPAPHHGNRLLLQTVEWERCKPVYETVPGWMQDISSCRSWEEIPEQAKKFVKRMSELIGCPVTTVGVGPDREQTIAVQ